MASPLSLLQSAYNAFTALLAKFPIVIHDHVSTTSFFALGGSSTSSGSYVALYGVLLNGLRGGNVYINIAMTVSNNSSTGQYQQFGVQLDGGSIVAMTASSSPASGYYQYCGGRMFVGRPAPGNHTLTVYWLTSGGATATIIYGGMHAEEVCGD